MHGPKIIFDKSFLHRLKAEHLFELDIFFDIMPTPILKREIFADLSKPESSKTDWEKRGQEPVSKDGRLRHGPHSLPEGIDL